MMQQSLTLSSSEAKWVALSEAVKKVMFIIQVLGSMKILVKLPVTVRIDNISIIFMASNITILSCTKKWTSGTNM